MTTIEIEKGIPVPDMHTRGSRYPFAEMAIGDSVFIPGLRSGDVGGRTARVRRRLGFKFCSRTAVVNDVPGVRIWRVE